MRHLFVIMLFLLSLCAYAQTGNYFLAHYTPPNQHFNNVCFEIAQDENGVMYFASKAGVLGFDGRNWDLLKRKAAVFAIHISADGEKYWAGADGFGRIGRDANGFQELQVIKDSTDTDVVQTISVKNDVYFLSDAAIYQFNASTKKLIVISPSAESGLFTRLFEIYGAVYVNTERAGIYKIDNGALHPSHLPIKNDVIFLSRIDNDYVVGTSDNKIYTFNESLELKTVTIEDHEYADASVVVSGSWINRQLLALGTLRGGIMFINPITGKTQEIINYSTGLPDNEVFALMSDRNQNIWVSHDYGFTRISPYMPFRSFSHYSGLQGNLLCAFSSKDGVYVGTSLGLFKLKKEDLYDELVYFVDVEIPKKGSPKAKEVQVTGEVQSEPEKTESKKRGIFGFLRRNKAKETAENQVTAKASGGQGVAGNPTSVPETSQPKYRKEKRTQKVLRASQFVYKKVDGIDAKITSIIEVNGRLIASGLGGVFEVSDLKAKAVMKEPVHYLYASENENMLFAATYDDKVRSLVFESGQWQSLDLLDNIDDQINFIFEAGDRQLWLCGMDRIYRYQITDYNVIPEQTIDLSNSDAEKTIGLSDDGRVLFVNTEGFLQYDETSGRLVRIDSLPAPTQYFASHGNLLYLDQHGWSLTGKLDGHANLKLLNLFQDLRFITTDEREGDIWMISSTNELFKLFGERLTVEQEAFPVLLKSLTFQDQRKGFQTHLSLSEDKSAVTFEIIQPDYLSPEAVEFRYKVVGMKNEDWTEWSADNNAIHFRYLPPGEYTLEVQTKNIFGRTTELKPYAFRVLPPYWKRAWFYAMEFAMLASLVLLSFRLNTKYRIVSRILSLLTIILLIEFIQTLINATIPFGKESPVVDFIIQVVVALMVLPVEGYLRNLMFRSLDGSSKFYQFISPKAQPGLVEKESEELLPTDDV
jgi:hypothetical protein